MSERVTVPSPLTMQSWESRRVDQLRGILEVLVG
jgi:hypothetical protein